VGQGGEGILAALGEVHRQRHPRSGWGGTEPRKCAGGRCIGAVVKRGAAGQVSRARRAQVGPWGSVEPTGGPGGSGGVARRCGALAGGDETHIGRGCRPRWDEDFLSSS
jgi:hypothetical protein